MNNLFKVKLNKIPLQIIDGVYYYGSKEEGDQFTEEDVKL